MGLLLAFPWICTEYMAALAGQMLLGGKRQLKGLGELA